MSSARDAGALAAPRDSKRDLLDAATAAIEATRGSGVTPHLRRKGPRLWYLCATSALSLVGVWMLLAQPDWFLTPPAPPESAEMQTASARLGIVREVHRVEQFYEANGRLPATLLEARSTARGVTYTRLGTREYMLSLTTDTGTVTYRSGTPVETFLESSLRTISARGKP